MEKKNIPLLKVHMPKNAGRSVLKTLNSGFITEGPKVHEFEKLVGEFIGNQNVIATNSCTGAIQIALQIAGVKNGSEVISTAMTCQATNQPILQTGADIVWADIQPDTGNISYESIKEKITSKTKAIMMMHWGGQPCDISEINQIAKERDIFVIEDAASAFGAEYHNQKIGTHSDFVCFSFGAVKHITTGDGGLLAMRNPSLVERAVLLKNQGNNKKVKRTEVEWYFNITEPGWKFSMNDISASIGIIQLQYQKQLLEKRNENALFYDQHLKNIPGLKTLTRKTDRKSADWIYTVLVEKKENFVRKLKEFGIQTSIVHQRNDIHEIYSRFRTDLPGLDKFYSEMINIPVGWWLTNEDREFIVSVIKEGW
jgi:dTDP-4-amino-4,6-dideoxygalactose transaminase